VGTSLHRRAPRPRSERAPRRANVVFTPSLAHAAAAVRAKDIHVTTWGTTGDLISAPAVRHSHHGHKDRFAAVLDSTHSVIDGRNVAVCGAAHVPLGNLGAVKAAAALAVAAGRVCRSALRRDGAGGQRETGGKSIQRNFSADPPRDVRESDAVSTRRVCPIWTREQSAVAVRPVPQKVSTLGTKS
jgi:hypothetical protein